MIKYEDFNVSHDFNLTLKPNMAEALDRMNAFVLRNNIGAAWSGKSIISLETLSSIKPSVGIGTAYTESTVLRLWYREESRPDTI